MFSGYRTLADSMASSAELVLSDDERVEMQQFLESYGLQELEAIFLEKGVAEPGCATADLDL